MIVLLVAARLGTHGKHIILACPPLFQSLCLNEHLSPKVQVPRAKLSQGLVLYLDWSMGLPELDPCGEDERPPLGVSRPAGEAQRLGDLEPRRLPLPFPLGT